MGYVDGLHLGQVHRHDPDLDERQRRESCLRGGLVIITDDQPSAGAVGSADELLDEALRVELLDPPLLVGQSRADVRARYDASVNVKSHARIRIAGDD
jgi:hypothetical protein